MSEDSSSLAGSGEQVLSLASANCPLWVYDSLYTMEAGEGV